MKKIKIGLYIFLLLPVLFVFLNFNVAAQFLDKSSDPNKPADYFAGTGCMIGGDLWEAFMPANLGPFSSEAATAATKGIRTLIRVGNFDRNWTVPGGQWPNGSLFSYYWGKEIYAVVYDPDPTFYTKQVGGVDNTTFPSTEVGAATYSNYAVVTFGPNLDGAKDPLRTYSKEPYWADGNRRQHLVYEAGFVTNVGLDVKMRAHQFSGPNWNNLNDYIIVEISVKNTGNVDMNLDGKFEKTGHKIVGLAFMADGEYSPSFNATTGARWNSWITNPSRVGGYIGDPDPDGSPWNINLAFIAKSSTAPAAGGTDMGLLSGGWRTYTDTWQGWSWIGAKKGSIPTDVTQGTGKSVDKPLIFDIPAIGTGTQRGWFLSAGTSQGGTQLVSYDYPGRMFYGACATFFANAGRDNIAANLDFSYNPKFFASGTKGAIETFKPKKTSGWTEADRPNGDRKYFSIDAPTSAIYQSDEDGTSEKGKPYPTGFGKLSTGFINMFNYDGNAYQGMGPFGLDVGEEMTASMTYVSGFRLEGLQKSTRAARYAYENNYVIPQPPPVPEMKVSNTDVPTILVEWDKAAETDAGFAGYKIWRSCQFIKYKWLESGMRLVDRFQEQMDPMESKDTYKKPINPKFDAFAFVNATPAYRDYAGQVMGTWELIKVIPKASLGTLSSARSTGYNYSYEDKNTVIGGSYWYYISAYKEGTFTGPGGETTTRIESHNINRNGADGLWQKTFPYSTARSFFPSLTTEPDRYKKIGGVQILASPSRSIADISAGKYKVSVRPNPYKKAALHDDFGNSIDHKLMFYNLPPKAKITILDVTGKIITTIDFASTVQGSIFWDMFSKDGMEVASGLYIYYVEWDGGSVKGKFAILR